MMNLLRPNPKEHRGKWLAIAWLLGICYLAFIHNLGNTGLVDETEPLFAEASRTMTVTGNWITPYFNGETRFDKPPLVYWAMAMGYHLIGVNEWAVRLPSALSAIALVALGFYTLIKFAPHRPYLTAAFGASLMALNPETWIWGRIGVSDMLLCGCMGGALLCFFHGYNQPQRDAPPELEEAPAPSHWNLWRPHPWYLACYGLMGLAVLTKGPVGVVLPGLILLSFLVYGGQFGPVVREMGLVTGAMVFVVITVPWYVLAYLENGQVFIDSFFGYHNLERFTHVVNGHDAPWYFYFVVVLLGFAPCSVYLPWSFGQVQWWKRSLIKRQSRAEHLMIFLVMWFVVIFGFFSIAITKLPSYVLPLMPAAGMMVSLTALSPSPSALHRDRGLTVTAIANIIFLLALTVVFFLLPRFIGFDPVVPNLAELVGASGLPLRGAGVWGLGAIALITILALNQHRLYLWAINLITIMLFIAIVLYPMNTMVDQLRQLPLREMASVIKEVKQVDEEIWSVGFKKPSLSFYTQMPIRFFNTQYVVQEYIDHQTVATPTVLWLSRQKFLDKFDLKPTPDQVITQKGVYYLLRFDRGVVQNLELAPNPKS